MMQVMRPSKPVVPMCMKDLHGNWTVQGHIDDPGVVVLAKAQTRKLKGGEDEHNSIKIKYCYTTDHRSARKTTIR